MRGRVVHSLHSVQPAHMEKVSNPPPAIYPLRAGLHPEKDKSGLTRLVDAARHGGARPVHAPGGHGDKQFRWTNAQAIM